ncbi:putative vacuolar protein sorting-associated protein 54 [Triangularia verruculosa]|uniref:Vacuolar protein sorting-associated protein 54 n=1 Tax=Triangularia verruculosa TaxID=2587418 RepID=A0AAN6XP50_9PEZI|nr:putative vacuolar protein sorting-associated protein 54 [Triangularia verruculosa]
MFTNQGGRKSVDSLSSTLSGHRTEFPFHGKGPSSPQRQRRDSTASSIYSVGGSLDASTGWTNAVFESGQNAISTLLQPPIVRTGLLPHTSAPASSAHKPPTARDIPPVTLTNVPHVDASEFKPYLSQVGALYEQLRRIQAEEDENANALNRRNTKTDEAPDTPVDEGHLRPARRPGLSSRRTSTASITSLSSIESPTVGRRSSSGLRSRQAQGPPPLSTVPAVYFEEDFHLENPRTFDVVSERSEVVRPAPGDDKGGPNGQAAAPRKALATNAILQEKLSWYMDTIEWHLIQSISTASTTFFSALGSLRELHSEAADSVERIKALRKELETLDEEIATGGLNIVQQRRKRENLKQLHDAVAQLRKIVDGVAVCESLVDAGSISEALDNIDALERLISGELPEDASQSGAKLVDLRGATALQGVSSDLATLRFRIGKAYEARFLHTLLTDLQNHVKQVSTREVLMRWSSASMRARGAHSREPSAFPSYMAATDVLRVELLPSLTGLHRAKFITVAATAYREAAMKEIKAIIRRPLPSSSDDDDTASMMSMQSSSTRNRGASPRTQQDRSIKLARNLRALDALDAEKLLIEIYIGVTEALRRLGTQMKVLLDVASTIGDSGPSGLKSPPLRSPPMSPPARPPSRAAVEAQEEIHAAVDISNFLGQAIDTAQEKIVKVLRVRSEQSKRLDLISFLRYFTLNLHFANECEAISGRSGTSLKTLVNGHITDFVKLHGDAQTQQLAQGMESDQWNAADFTEKDTELLNRILECSTRDAAAWTEGTQVWYPHPDAPKKEGEGETNGGDEPDVLSAQTNGGSTANNAAAARNKTRSAVIETESYLLPNSAILCMTGMENFLQLINSIPSMTTDISSSLIAYLQLFNSRCKQLILGAGATRSAGLRNITTKHLALASQALAFMAAIIPHVREFVRRHCTSTTVTSTMGEFDKVRRDFMEHQNSIYDKLVEIMTGRVGMAGRKLRSLPWNDASAADGVSEYMEGLAKDTITLHKNLTRHLPEGTVRYIMMPVFRNYKDTLGAAFAEVEVSGVGKERMLRDVEFFESRLGKIDGFEDAGEHLLKIINSKTVKEPTPPASSLMVDKIPSKAGSRSASPAPPLPPGQSLHVRISTSLSNDDEEGKRSTESKEGSSSAGKNSIEERKSPATEEKE